MSRFFVSGYLDSSEEEDLLSTSEEELLLSSDDSDFPTSDDDLDSLSDDDEDRPAGPAYFLKKAFLKGGHGDDSDSDEDRKVVKLAKEKLVDEIKDVVEQINVARRQNNFTLVLTDLDRLNKLVTRAQNLTLGLVPNQYIKCLGGLELCINEVQENEKNEKTLSAQEAKAFTTVRQRVRKAIKEHQELYDLYLEDPDRFDSDEPVRPHVESTPQPTDTKTTTGAGHPVFATLKAIAETRGKKNIDKYEQIATLEQLLADYAEKGTTFEKIAIYQMLLLIRFDVSTNQLYMLLGLWNANHRNLNDMLALLELCVDTYQLSEYGHTTDDLDIEPEANADGVRVIYGLVASLIDRFDDEFLRSLQNTDPHSIEYVARLKDESKVYQLVVRGQQYIERITPADKLLSAEQLGRIVARRLEHVYYKPDQVIEANEKAVGTIKLNIVKGTLAQELVDSLATYLSHHANPMYPTQLLLLLIYYYAVNNRFDRAMSLFLDLKIYNDINLMDSLLQVAYNRALVQLGLCAFRQGQIAESHRILNEIINQQRLKELLGQGFLTKYPNQATTVEKQKLLPFHMHINLELLECVYMTLLLLLEIPALAAAEKETLTKKLKVPAKLFKSKLEFHERQFFTGPPESIKDHIVYALIALQKGDWHKAYNLLSSIKIWRLFPDNQQLLAMLKHQLQIEGLRTYVFSYRSIYTKLSLPKLALIFELPRDTVEEIVSKMLAHDISGTISGNFINFNASTEPQRTRLQELAIIMNEKAGLLKDKNEKTQLNGYLKKPPQPKEPEVEEDNKFRYAYVNTNNDEFQSL